MRCMMCGEEMRVVRSIPDETSLVPGFEHHTLLCPSCHDEEQRLVFVHHPASLSPATETDGGGPDVHEAILQPADQPAAAGDVLGEEASGVRTAEVDAAERGGPHLAAPQLESFISQHARAANSRIWGRTAELHRARWRLLCDRLGLRGAGGKADEAKEE